MLTLALLMTATGAGSAGAIGLPSRFGPGARVDVNAAGQAVVAWAGPNGVRVAVGDRTTGLGAPTQLAAAGADGFAQAAISDTGEVIVIWETSHLTPGGGCSTCGANTLSDGVWAALRPAGATAFGAPVALVPAPPDRGAYIELYKPRMAMNRAGDAVVAWSDRSGAVAALRPAGGAFGPPQRVAAAPFAVFDAAVGPGGGALVSSDSGLVAARPAGGALWSVQPLPDSAGQSYSAPLLASNSSGDALAVYTGARGVEASRRTAGAWAPPQVLTTAQGAGPRAVALSDSGAGAATFLQTDGDPWMGYRTRLLAAGLPAAGPPVVEQVNARGLDAEMGFDGPGLDMDGSGRVALAFDRHDGIRGGVAQLTFGGAYDTPATLTTPGALEHAAGDGADVALGTGGSVLVAWTDLNAREMRLNAQWIAPYAIGPVTILDRAAPWAPAMRLTTPHDHAVRVLYDPRVTASPTGRIAVRLRCQSADGLRCRGTLTITGGPPHWEAGHARFAVGAGSRKRVQVALGARARAILRRRGHVVLRATARTDNPGYAPPRSSRALVVVAPNR